MHQNIHKLHYFSIKMAKKMIAKHFCPYNFLLGFSFAPSKFWPLKLWCFEVSINPKIVNGGNILKYCCHVDKGIHFLEWKWVTESILVSNITKNASCYEKIAHTNTPPTPPHNTTSFLKNMHFEVTMPQLLELLRRFFCFVLFACYFVLCFICHVCLLLVLHLT